MASFVVNGGNIHAADVHAEPIWEVMTGFAKYCFNKSHSVAYSMIAYTTAELWTYHRNEMLEWLLNDGTEKNQTAALDVVKRLGMHMDYPDLFHMGDQRYHIETQECTGGKREILHVPIPCNRSWDSYVRFLMNDGEERTGILIQSGVCDALTEDREALFELVTTIPPTKRRLASNMETECYHVTTLPQLLDGLKACEAVTDWETQNDGNILVSIQKKKLTTILFHKNGSDECRRQRVAMDLKIFGSVRNGLLSDLPTINTLNLQRSLQRIREIAERRGENPYPAMRDYMNDHIRTYWSDPRKSVFDGVYALLTDFVEYSSNGKLFLTFGNCSDIFYVKKDAIPMIKRLPANTLVRLRLQYSPYVAKRNLKFIYDFDILSVEAIR